MANARDTIDMKVIKAASQQATNYISLDESGITVADLTNGTSNLGKNVFIDSTSVNVRDGSTVLSSFTGDGVFIGQNNKASLSLTSSEISATTNAGVEFFNIASGTAYEEETISGSIELTNSSSSETEFSSSTSVPFDIEYETTVSFTANIGITVDGVSSTRNFRGQYTYSYSEEGTAVEYGEQGATAYAYSMTFKYGTVTGENIVNLKATITPVSGHTAIIDSVTFNYTATSRKYQSKMYTFGTRGEESDIGEGSFTVGDYMIASSPSQFVIGKYNEEDTNGDYAFIIGNGSDIGEYRSNGFAVGWGGDVETNSISLKANSLSYTDNFISCINTNGESIFTVAKTTYEHSDGAVISNVPFISNGATIFNGTIDINNGLDVGGALTTTGNASIGGTLTSTGKVTANNGLSVSGATSLDGSVTADGKVWIQGGSASGGDYNRIVINNGSPSDIRYGSGNRGTVIYSNGIAFADPKNGSSNTDAGWIRHIEDTANSGYLEIAVSDDGNEPVYVRQYNTSNSVVKQVTLLDASGNTTFPGTVTTAGLNSTGNIRANGSALFTRSTKKYTDIGIGANGAYYPSPVKDISLTGYKPVAVFGIWVENNASVSSSNADASWCVVPSYWINSGSSTLNFYIWNQHTSKSVRVDIEFQILYAADSIL